MSIRGTLLEHDGQGREEENLNSRSGSIPERTRDAVSVADTGTLQEGGCPRPRGDDGGGDESRLHGAAGRVEHLGRLDLIVVAFEDVREADLREVSFVMLLLVEKTDHEDSKGEAYAEDDAVAGALA